LISDQEQKVKQKQAETKRLEARIEAESLAEISKIEMEKQILAKESKRKMEEIENKIYIEKEKSKADAHHYKVLKMIEAEQMQLTPQYLRMLAIQSISNNTKIYFGESIPKFIMENMESMVSESNELKKKD